MQRDVQLAAEGWRKRSSYEEPRLSEIVAMYEEIGLEVRIEPFNPLETPGCSQCMKRNARRYRTVYTRDPR